MKGYRFYAELPENRQSKSASKYHAAFNMEFLRELARKCMHCNVVAVLTDERGYPYMCGSNGDQMEAIAPVYGTSNSPVVQSMPSARYLRTRCVRIDADLAKKLHPKLFEYLEG